MSIRFHSRNRKYCRHLKQNDFSIGAGKLREYQADKAITQKLVTVTVERSYHSFVWDNKGKRQCYENLHSLRSGHHGARTGNSEKHHPAG